MKFDLSSNDVDNVDIEETETHLEVFNMKIMNDIANPFISDKRRWITFYASD